MNILESLARAETELSTEDTTISVASGSLGSSGSSDRSSVGSASPGGCWVAFASFVEGNNVTLESCLKLGCLCLFGPLVTTSGGTRKDMFDTDVEDSV